AISKAFLATRQYFLIQWIGSIQTTDPRIPVGRIPKFRRVVDHCHRHFIFIEVPRQGHPSSSCPPHIFALQSFTTSIISRSPFVYSFYSSSHSMGIRQRDGAVRRHF